MDLKKIKKDNNLTVARLAEMMGCSTDHVKTYLYRPGAEIPEYRQRLLKFELEKLKNG